MFEICVKFPGLALFPDYAETGETLHFTDFLCWGVGKKGFGMKSHMKSHLCDN